MIVRDDVVDEQRDQSAKDQAVHDVVSIPQVDRSVHGTQYSRWDVQLYSESGRWKRALVH